MERIASTKGMLTQILGWMNCSLAIIVALFTSGCQSSVHLSHENLVGIQSIQPRRSIQAYQLGECVRKELPNTVGTHSFTVFAIPTGTINSDMALPVAVHSFVRVSLVDAGYNVIDISQDNAQNAPIIRGEITNYWLTGYSYFWPIFLQRGKFDYSLIVQMPNGRVLWKKSFEARATDTHVGVDYGYDSLAAKINTDILNKVREAISSSDFVTVLDDAR